jgi:hypothetical protein
MASLQWSLSVTICKRQLAELKWKNVFKIHFSVYTVLTKVMDNDFEFSKIDFKTEFEKEIFKWPKTNCFSKQAICHR